MADDDEATPPGWYRQPEDPATLRWWDGDDWTDDTMPAPAAAGRRSREAPAAGAPADDEPTTVSERARGDDAAGPTSTATAPRRRAAAGRDGRPVLRFGDDAPAAVEIELEPVGGPGPAPRRSPVSPGAVARVGRIGELEEDWSSGSLPEGMGEARRSPARRPAGDRPGAGVRPGRDRDARTPPGRVPDGRAPARAGGPPRRAGEGPLGDGARPGAPGPRRPPVHGTATRPRRMAQPSSPEVASLVRILVRAGAIALVVLVVWVGYSKLVAAEPDRARTLSKDAPAVATDRDAPPLAQVVLTLSDLPRGWSSLAAPTNAGICDGRVPETVIVPTASQSATFTQDETQAIISSTVDDFADEDTAKAFLDLAARVIDSCRDSSANGTTTHLTPLRFPRFGDDTFAAALSSTTAQGSLRGELVYLRHGTRVATVTSIQLTDDPVDEDLLQLLVGRVSNRLSRKARPTATLPSEQPQGEATLPGE